MHILCIIEDLGSGGAQRQLVNLAVYLKRSGNNIEFLTYYQKVYYTKLLKQEAIGHTLLEIKNPLKRIYHFRKYIRSGDFDAVIAFLSIPAFLAEAAAFPSKRFRLIVGERSTNPKLQKSLKSLSMRLFHLFADHIVANSYANLDMVREINPLLPDHKLKVIYNAIDLNKFKPQKEFQFKNNDLLRMIIPASYRQLKNLLRLIEAVSRLSKREKQNLSIEWYGDKSNRNNPDFILYAAEKLVARYDLQHVFTFNDVHWEIEKKIQQADLVGLFSIFEGLPNAICEGMACGKPVLSSNVSDAPKLVQEGINGKLCNPWDINSIKEGIQYFLRLTPDQMQQMGKQNRSKAIAIFDSQKIHQEYAGLLQ